MCALSGDTVAIKNTAVGLEGREAKWKTECEGGLQRDFNSLKRFCEFILRSRGRRDEER